MRHLQLQFEQTQRDLLICHFDSSRSKDYYASHGKVDNINLEISLICNKLPDEYNGLYKIVGSTVSGPLYLLEQLLNVIDKTTGGAVDLALGATLNKQIGYAYDVKVSPTFIEFSIKVQIETAQFTSGAR
jgi:hypothetical protein